MKERKQDVFNELWRLAAEDRRMTGGELLALQARYVAACKVPVPREVGEWIDMYKQDEIDDLQEAFNDLYVDTDEAVTSWVDHHANDFARAWLNGWYAEKDAK